MTVKLCQSIRWTASEEKNKNKKKKLIGTICIEYQIATAKSKMTGFSSSTTENVSPKQKKSFGWVGVVVVVVVVVAVVVVVVTVVVRGNWIVRDEVVNLTVAAFHVVVVKSIKSAAAAICAISTSRCSLHSMDLFFSAKSKNNRPVEIFFSIFPKSVF